MGDEVISANADSGANVLRVGADGWDEQDVCRECAATATSASTKQIVVTVERSADEWLADHQRHGALPENVVVVSAGEDVRSTTAASSGTITSPPEPIGGPVIDTAPTEDLSALGVVLSQHIQRIDADSAGTKPDVRVCIDSLSGLLDANDTEFVFRFLHLITRQVESVGATAHYHIDTEKHDPQTIATLAPLFDGTTTADFLSQPQDGFSFRHSWSSEPRTATMFVSRLRIIWLRWAT